ncbi:MAG TPA: dihydroorotate dehydrogenase-like protein [Bacteroidales bacterium]|nr:dihydroorotate dehydrogenase-like protein [Bacteroidales bacterium]
MADLSTNYMGFKLKNPIIAGSTGLSMSVENLKSLEKHGAAAVVLKSLFEEQIMHEVNKALAGTDNKDISYYPEAEDYIRHYTKEKDLNDYLRLIENGKKSISIPLIASINCFSASEWTTFAKKIESAGADGLELNIFILPSDTNREPSQNEQVYFDVVTEVLKQVSIPIALKISYYFSGLAKTALKLSWTGISGMVLFNRFFSPDIDINKFIVTPSHVFSTKDEIYTTLRWIAMLSNRLHCDIAGSTGVHDGEGAVKLLLAGAKAVQIATILYKNGFETIGEMIRFIEQWMDKHDFKTTEEFIGKLSMKSTENPAAYERVQFMKHFAGIY